MKCHICNNETTWNESFGKETFIVCPSCHRELTNRIKVLRECGYTPEGSALDIIITIGIMKEERK